MNANINQQHMFSNKMIRALLVPIILEQLLNSIMGTADTMMVPGIFRIGSRRCDRLCPVHWTGE